MKHKNHFKDQKKISKNDLLIAIRQGLISSDQAEKLWDTITFNNPSTKPSRMLQFIYYFGAFLVISALTWFMTLGWSMFGGGGLFLIALSYGVAFFTSGYLLWQKGEFRILSGLLVTIAVCTVPIAILGLLEECMNLWPTNNWVERGWLFIEVGTILAGLVAVKYVRFPFITAPIAASFWFLSMDLTPFLFGEFEFTWVQKCWVSLILGLGMLSVSYLIDRSSRKDFAFWGYFFGTLTFWGGLSLLVWTSELNWLFYFTINMVMMIGSIFLRRNILMIFGALGCLGYLGHLADQVFINSIVFPFSLSFVGIIIIVLGFLYQKKASSIRSSILTLLNRRFR